MDKMEPEVLGEPEWRSKSNEDMDVSCVKVKDEEVDSDKEMSKECLDPSRFVMANMEWTQVDYEGPREPAKLIKNCSEGNGNPVSGVNIDFHREVSDRNVNKDIIKDEEEDSDSKDTCFDPSKFVKTEIEWPQASDEGPAQPQLKAINKESHNGDEIKTKLAFVCPYCGKDFHRHTNLKIHIQSVHTVYSTDEIRCPICSKELKNPTSLKRHIREVHTQKGEEPIGVHICDECGNEYKRKKDLMTHRSQTHKVDVKICEFCFKEYKNQTKLKQHMRMVHGGPEEPVICDLCSKIFKRKRELNVHKSQTHKVDVKKCEFCFKEYKNQTKLKQHLRLAHSGPEDPVTCEQCNKIFRRKKDLQIHRSQTHKVDIKKCEFCFNEYNNQTKLKQHLRLVHGAEEHVTCKQCNKTFGNMTKLKHHHVDVHLVQPSMCNDCGKTFKNRWLMRKHQRYLHSSPEAESLPSFPTQLPNTAEQLLSLAHQLSSNTSLAQQLSSTSSLARQLSSNTSLAQQNSSLAQQVSSNSSFAQQLSSNSEYLSSISPHPASSSAYHASGRKIGSFESNLQTHSELEPNQSKYSET